MHTLSLGESQPCNTIALCMSTPAQHGLQAETQKVPSWITVMESLLVCIPKAPLTLSHALLTAVLVCLLAVSVISITQHSSGFSARTQIWEQ